MGCYAYRFSLWEAILCLISSGCIATQITTASAYHASGSSSTGNSICPSGSINYITHGLPQQCLTSSWASRPGPWKSEEPAKTTTSPLTAITTPTLHEEARSDSTTTANATTSAESSLSSLSTSSTAAQPTTETGSTAPPSNSAKEKQDDVQENEAESPLDNANFLSFEEWKRQNLIKAGQSAEKFAARESSGDSEQRRRQGPIHNALDTLGEESEIDIDFGGFVNPGRMGDAMRVHTGVSDGTTGAMPEPSIDGGQPNLSNARRRSKDAGKTCKERFNYASFDCAANVLKTNPECKGSTSVLVENKDSYMLNVCAVKNKFFIVELCEAILVDTVVLANFEFFSSMFRTFKVSVSDEYPVQMDMWKALGVFEARNSRGVQAFLVQNPLIWARYLRVEFLTHYGTEYYCPLSLLRVHGTTMIDEFNNDMKGSKAGDAGYNEIEESAGIDGYAVSEPISTVVLMTASETIESSNSPTKPEISSTASKSTSDSSASTIGAMNLSSTSTPAVHSSAYPQPFTCPIARPFAFVGNKSQSQCTPNRPNQATASTAAVSNLITSQSLSSESSPSLISQSPTVAVPKKQDDGLRNSSSLQTALMSTSSTLTPPPVEQNTELKASSSSAPTTATSSRIVPSSSQPAPPNPTTQESFFKSVHKRLQQLEANSTLSLQYIEEQSRILRDAFSKVEKRQLAKTSGFLETLNTTVLTELRDFRTQYDQIWQSTVLELSSQRAQSQHEVSALSKRLNYLTDEVVFQKRVAVLQFMLVVICLGFLMFPRQGSNSTYLELPPLVQTALNRSSTSLSRSLHSDALNRSPTPTRPSSRYGLFRSWTHRRSPSEDSDVPRGSKSPTIEFSPPTPESIRSLRDQEESSSAEESRSQSDDSPMRRHELLRNGRSKTEPLLENTAGGQGTADTSPSPPKADGA